MLLGSGSRKALESWGGELELIVLSEHFDAHLIAIDIQTGRAYIYGEGRPGYKAILGVTPPDIPC